MMIVSRAVLLLTLAWAPSPEAVAAFEEGQERFANADYEGALEAFHRAQSIQPAPALHYNIGLSHLRLGEYEQAIASLQTYLELADPPDRADIEYMLADARAKLEAQTRPEPTERPQPAPEVVEREVVVMVERKPHRPFVIAGATTLAVGGVMAIAGGIGFGVAVNRRNETIDDFNATGGMSGLSPAEVLDLEDEAKRFQTLEFVSIGVGAAVAVTGAALLGVGLKRRAAQLSSRLRIDGTGLVVAF